MRILCKTRYRPRYFYSKGAYLVLIWVTLVSASVWSSGIGLNRRVRGNIPEEYQYIADILPLPFYLFIPLIGWLADAKYGNYTMFKFGCCVLLCAAVFGSVVFVYVPHPNHQNDLLLVLLNAVCTAVTAVGIVTGTAACCITAVQLGLDQMPDASSSNIASFIAWFVFSVVAGIWVSDMAFDCMIQITHVFTIFPAVCMAIVCC